MEEKREIVYSDISSASRKKPYDAMVYIEGTSVIAVDSIGKVIAKGTAGTDDATVIQAAIDACPENGGTVNLGTGGFTITSTILLQKTLDERVELVGSGQATTLTMGADVIGIRLLGSRYVRLANFKMIPSDGHTAAMIKIETSGSQKLAWFNTIENIAIIADSDNHAWTGIEFNAADSTHSSWTIVKNIDIRNCATGIAFIRVGSGYTTANIFSGIRIHWYGIGIDFGTDGGVSNTNFSDIIFQTGGWSTDVWKNISSFISIINDFIWDWTTARNDGITANYIYSFLPAGANNLVYNTYYALIPEYVSYAGSNNTIFTPGMKRPGVFRDKNLLVVSSESGNYTKLSTALASITDAAVDNRYVIYVIGDITETTRITPKSYVDIIGVGNATVTVDIASGSGANLYGLYASAVTNFLWKDLTLIRTGSATSGKTCAISFCRDGRIENCKFVNSCDTADVALQFSGNCTDLDVIDTTAEVLTGAAAALSNADDLQIRFYNCTAVGGPDGGSAWIIYKGYPYLENCTARSHITTSPAPSAAGHGFNIYLAACPVLKNCHGVPYAYHDGSYALRVANTASPFVSGGSFGPDILKYTWSYISDDNGRFRALEATPILPINLSVMVNVATAGANIDIGTTVGGHEIVSNLSIATTGSKTFVLPHTELGSGDYIYVTPSTGISAGDITIHMDYVTNCANCYGLYLDTDSVARFVNCDFHANAASDAVYVNEAVNLMWTMANCSLETMGITNSFAINASSAIKPAKMKGCALVGLANNVTSINGENSGAAANVADGGTIAHGCVKAPTKVTLTGSVAGEMVTVTSINATNITVAIKKPDGSAGTTQTVYWRAEV